MKTASELRQQREQYEVDRVMTRLEGAAMSGQDTAFVPDWMMMDHVRAKLVEAGYVVEEPQEDEEDGGKYYPVSFAEEQTEIKYEVNGEE